MVGERHLAILPVRKYTNQDNGAAFDRHIPPFDSLFHRMSVILARRKRGDTKGGVVFQGWVLLRGERVGWLPRIELGAAAHGTAAESSESRSAH